MNWRLCSEEMNDKLTGYSHNSVTPLGMKNEMLMIVSHEMINVPTEEQQEEGCSLRKFVWLGGGHVDIKWKVDIDELCRVFKAKVADITYSDAPDAPNIKS